MKIEIVETRTGSFKILFKGILKVEVAKRWMVINWLNNHWADGPRT